uniref:major histocompatibility complex class I-related gene protein-like isoform X2 n=1 Tax=Pristiophorus japonicus TaxID=55135 RepID=UPI00398F7D0A
MGLHPSSGGPSPLQQRSGLSSSTMTGPLPLVTWTLLTGSHSLRYFLTWMTPIPGVPWFVVVGYLDDTQISEYDSDRKVAIPRQQWVEERQGAEYLQWVTQRARFQQQRMKVYSQDILTWTNHSDGMHTMQMFYGCELRDDGTTDGLAQYAWDGDDYISFDKDRLVWDTSVPWGVSTKHKWDLDTELGQQCKGFLEQECITWLKKQLQAGERELRAVAPAVSFTRPGDAKRLSCVATGFYPQAIEVTLWRDGVFLAETQSSGILPNHDGTFQVRSCEVEHGGLQRKVIVFYVHSQREELERDLEMVAFHRSDGD